MQDADDPLETFLRAYDARDDDAAWDIYKRSHAAAGNRITRALVDGFLARTLSVIQPTICKPSTTWANWNFAKRKTHTRPISPGSTPLRRLKQKHFWSRLDEQMAKGFKLSRGSEFGAAMELFVSARTSFRKIRQHS